MELTNHTKIFIVLAITLLIIIIIAFLFRKDLNIEFSKRFKGDPLVELDVYNNIREVDKGCGNDKCKPELPLPKAERPIIPSNTRQKEVFNVSKNIYTYDDASSVCKALDSELATFDQVQKAYDNGGDWCNYGWTKGQMALYPTQQSTWKKLQKAPKEYRNECGHPGINGGYFDNKYLKFGVNCYGYKPGIKENDRELLDYSPAPRLSEEEKRERQKIRQYRSARARNDLTILPFKKNCWNKKKFLEEEEELEQEIIRTETGYSSKNLNELNIPDSPLEDTIEKGVDLNNQLINSISNSVDNVNSSLSSSVANITDQLNNETIPTQQAQPMNLPNTTVNQRIQQINNQNIPLNKNLSHGLLDNKYPPLTSEIQNIGTDTQDNTSNLRNTFERSVTSLPNSIGLKIKNSWDSFAGTLF
jgi:hypothetical protein